MYSKSHLPNIFCFLPESFSPGCVLCYWGNCSLVLDSLAFCTSASLLTSDWFWLQDLLIRIHFKCGWTSKIDFISVSEVCSEQLWSVLLPFRPTYRCGTGPYGQRFRIPSEFTATKCIHLDGSQRNYVFLKDKEHYPLDLGLIFAGPLLCTSCWNLIRSSFVTLFL